MPYIFTAIALYAIITFWGTGLADWATPRRWQWCWPAFVLAAGMALQSAVVWFGAILGLPGTNHYALVSQLLPAGLLLRAAHRRGWHRLLGMWWQWRGLHAVMLCCLVLLTLPLAWNADRLTTSSLASCDAADYAAGARVFKEFSATDREGFLGLTEVVWVGSTDNFFDFWKRLNHFTPSALMALNGSLLGLEPYEITGLITLVFLISALPVVYLLARALFGIRCWPALWVSLIYGLSPLTWYAAYHVASAQLIAATGIGWVTWWAMALWQSRRHHGRKLGLVVALIISFSLLWGAYNFIIVVSLVPALTIAGGQTLWAGNWRIFWRWLAWLSVALTISGLIYFERAAGLIERFVLFTRSDFGWRIPMLEPEGWLGLVSGPLLNEWSGIWGLGLSVLVIGGLGAAWLRCFIRRSHVAWIMPAVIGPVLIGYYYLQWRGWIKGTNASYDAYKLFAVFYPVLLGAFCAWLRWLNGNLAWGIAVWLGLVLVTLGNGIAAVGFATRMSVRPFKVDEQLVELQKIESMPGIASLNMRVPDLWDRLWANQFLLRKPQYFINPTYEGRRPTVQRGTWDLIGGLVQVRLPGHDSIALDQRFSVVKCASPWHVRVNWGEGWHGLEMWHSRKKVRWNWSGPEGRLRVTNPQPHPLLVRFYFDARSLHSQRIDLRVAGGEGCSFQVDDDQGVVVSPPLRLPPGKAVVTLHASKPTSQPERGDSRLLGMAVYGVVMEVLADEPPVP